MPSQAYAVSQLREALVCVEGTKQGALWLRLVRYSRTRAA